MSSYDYMWPCIRKPGLLLQIAMFTQFPTKGDIVCSVSCWNFPNKGDVFCSVSCWNRSYQMKIKSNLFEIITQLCFLHVILLFALVFYEELISSVKTSFPQGDHYSWISHSGSHVFRAFTLELFLSSPFPPLLVSTMHELPCLWRLGFSNNTCLCEA